MIDTTVLTLNDGFALMDKNRFTPSAELLSEEPMKLLGNQAYIKFTCNPTKEELRSGNYFPRLTLFLRKSYPGIAKSLRIEFSAPKLLYGNNFDELGDEDFDLVLTALHQRLKEMGVLVFKKQLENARVSAWHFSKNMPMQDYTSCSMVLNTIAKANVFTQLDLNARDYRNGGQAIKFHANGFEITFYDKLQDLANSRISEKRAIEKDNALQQALFNRETLDPNYEVLRMEVRLNTRRKLKSVLKAVGIERELTFKELFSWELSQAVLNHFWQPIRAALRIHTLSKLDAIELFEEMKKRNPSVSLAKLQRLHSTLVCLQAGNARRYRVALGFVGKDNSRWSLLMTSIKTLDLPTDRYFQISEKVRKGLIEFERSNTNSDKCHI